MSKEFILSTSRNNKLRISAFGLKNLETSPCLIFVHGFKGFKDWGFGPYLGKFFADKGFFVVTFNFSHNGVGESRTEFDELDKFAENTFSLEISELTELIDAYKNGFFGKTKNQKIGLVGHSRGGAISLLTASQKKDVDALAVWSSVAKLDRYSERQKENWKKKGVFEVLNQRTKQVMRLNLSLLEDIEKNGDTTLNIKRAVADLKRPLLLVHGEQDLAVPIVEGEQLFNWSDKTLTEFQKIPAAGHTFDIKHPFEGSNPKFDKVINLTIDFFNKHFN
ncbi:MAG: alpha/beta hydrolase [Ignavibacteria bacterium CG2_30_36_16]|nr:MAG: alpha/beta hydrolase [Ignavibacteria bacterium CG2_30_36_16]PJB01625.1 MAG: alpha/beta hydrolase [Ignavibacteria bacterium CG_4_9_14_3_um_filter_36_18]